MNKLNKRLVREYKLFKKKYGDDSLGFNSYAFSARNKNKLWLLKFYNNENIFLKNSFFIDYFLSRSSYRIKNKFNNDYEFFKDFLIRTNIKQILLIPEHKLISLEILEVLFKEYDLQKCVNFIRRNSVTVEYPEYVYNNLKNKYEILKLEKQLNDDVVVIENKTTSRIRKF